MKFLDDAATARALPYEALVPAIAQAARDLRAGAIKAPERLMVPMGSAGFLLCMPAVAADIAVTKLVTVHPQNAAQGLPAIQGEVVVMDAATGRRLLLLDGPTVTGRRTAAVTLLGIQTLLHRAPSTVLLIGTGTQAAAHADALVEFFDVRNFEISSRSLATAQAFCDALRARHPQVSAGPAAAKVTAHVVIAATTSKTPVIPADLPASTLAIGIGAFTPAMAELPPALLQSRRIVVDDIAGARHEAGDIIQAGVDWSRVVDIAGCLDAVATDATMPVFKTVGQAAWDLAAGRVALSALA